MVPQQVLRVAPVALTVLALCQVARADTIDPGDEVVIIIDLRRGPATERKETREALEKALVGISGVAPIDDDDLRAALAGEISDPFRSTANTAFKAAAEAYGKLDCAETRKRAVEAITALAAMQVRGDAVDQQLVQAYVYVFLCADKFADVDAANASASMLRQLNAGDPPPGISSGVWKTYPEIDAATNVLMVNLSVKTASGAEVWIDHERVGLAPLDVVVSEGNHLVAAATDAGAVATWIDVAQSNSSVELELTESSSNHENVRDTIAAWRGGKQATPKDLSALMTSLGRRVALVLAQEGKIEVWGVTKPGRPAKLLGSAARAMGVGAIVNEQVAAWDRGAAPDPNRELLRETRTKRAKDKKPLKWWVYASIIGAVAVGTAIVIANETADDRQRIEVTFP